MKEIKKISDLLDSYISFLTMRMQNRKKNIDIYNQWEIIVEEENLPIESYLDDVKSNTLFVHVSHPGNAQQIRMKNKKIIDIFNNTFSDLNIKKMIIIIDTVFNTNQNVPCGTYGKEL